jgi:hypothetical protein
VFSAIAGDSYAAYVVPTTSAFPSLLSGCRAVGRDTSSPNADTLPIVAGLIPGSPSYEIALSAISSLGAVARFYNVLNRTFTESVPLLSQPSITGAGILGFPHSVRLQKFASDRLLLLEADVVASPLPITIVASRSSLGEAFNFVYIGAVQTCTDADRFHVRHIALSPFSNQAILAVQSADARILNVHIFRTNDSNSLTKPSITGNNPVWATSDLNFDGELPVVFANNQTIFLARLPDTLDPVLVTITPEGSLVEFIQFINSSDPLKYAVSGQRLHFLNGTQLFSQDAEAPLRSSAVRNFLVATNMAITSGHSPLVWGYDGTVGRTRIYFPAASLWFEQEVDGLIDYVFTIPADGVDSFIALVAQRIQTGVNFGFHVYIQGNSSLNGVASLSTGARESPGVFFCGSFSGGAVVGFATTSAFELWVLNLTSSDFYLQYSRAEPFLGCEKLDLLGDQVFLLTFKSRVVLFDLAFLPTSPRLISPMKTGSHIAASTLFEAKPNRLDVLASVRRIDLGPYPFDAMTTISLGLCRTNADCSYLANHTCVDKLCSVAVLGSPPVQAPLLCQGPAPIVGAFCDITGRWVVTGNVVVNTTITSQSSITINGSLVLTPTGSIILFGNSTIEVTDCAFFAGSLQITKPAPETNQLNASIPIVSFGGFCNGTISRFAGVLLTFTGQDPCVKRENNTTLDYTNRLVSVIFTFDRSGCTTPTESAALSVGAIAGIVVGIVLFLAIIIAILLILKYKNIIQPYSSRERPKSTVELEAN